MNLLPVLSNELDRPFWASFGPLVPEAVRCHFFATAMGIADGRATEYGRESGPYLVAITRRHLPLAIMRLDTLKKIAESLVALCGEDDLRLKTTEGAIAEVMEIVVKFELEIVRPLEEIVKNNDDAGGKGVIDSLRHSVTNIARHAEGRFEESCAELEHAISKSVLRRPGRQPQFISVVSVDLAQYSRHLETVRNYDDVDGIFNLNRRIREAITGILKGQGLTEQHVVTINTGDGGLLVFLNPEKDDRQVANRACDFSEQFLKLFEMANSRVTDENHRLHFRVGISSGLAVMENTYVRKSDITQCHAGGLPLGQAVRLQSAARTGEIIACAVTCDNLIEEKRQKFGEKKEISGKVHERSTIHARCYTCVPPAPQETPGQTTMFTQGQSPT